MAIHPRRATGAVTRDTRALPRVLTLLGLLCILGSAAVPTRAAARSGQPQRMESRLPRAAQTPTIVVTNIGTAHVVRGAVQYATTFHQGDTIYVYAGYRTGDAGALHASATLIMLQSGHTLLSGAMAATTFSTGAPAFVGAVQTSTTDPVGQITAQVTVRLGSAQETRSVTFALLSKTANTPGPQGPGQPSADAGQVILPRLAPRPGFVIGRAVFQDGRLVPHFTVEALGFDGQVNLFPGSTPSLGAVDGANGRYALRTMDTLRHEKPVNATVVGVQASTTLPYHGYSYVLDLAPLDGLCDTSSKGGLGTSGKGVVRDFVVKLSGLKPCFMAYAGMETTEHDTAGGAFYGGNIVVNLTATNGTGAHSDIATSAPQGSTVTLTLAPSGPLLDGSTGHTVTRQWHLTTGHKWGFYLHSIPMGFYTAAAQLTEPGGAVRSLRLQPDMGSTGGSWSSSLPIAFVPTKFAPDGRSSLWITLSF